MKPGLVVVQFPKKRKEQSNKRIANMDIKQLCSLRIGKGDLLVTLLQRRRCGIEPDWRVLFLLFVDAQRSRNTELLL